MRNLKFIIITILFVALIGGIGYGIVRLSDNSNDDPPQNYNLVIDATDEGIEKIELNYDESVETITGVSKSFSIPENTNVSVTAFLKSGYVFERFSGDLSSSLNPFEFKLTKTTTIKANTTKQQVTISLLFDGGIESIEVKDANNQPLTVTNNSLTVSKGESLTFTAVLKDNFAFETWSSTSVSIENATNQTITISNITDDISLSASSTAQTVTLTLSGDDGIESFSVSSFVSKENNTFVVAKGTSVQITANLKENYDFVIWTGDYASPQTTITLENISQDKTISCITKKQTATLSLSKGEGILNFVVVGYSTKTNDLSYIVEKGSSVTITALLENSYTFESWAGDITGTENPITIENFSDNMSIEASATSNVETYTVTFVGDSGIESFTVTNLVQVSNNVFSAEKGASVIVTANLKEYYDFVSWTGDITGTQNPLSISNIQQNLSISANTQRQVSQVSLSFNTDHVEKVTVDSVDYTQPGTLQLNMGQTYTFVPTFKNGYEFDSWSEQGEENLVFIPTLANHTISLVAKQSYVAPTTFNVSVVSNNAEYGSVDIESVENVASGTTISANANTITIGQTVITATPSADDAQYDFEFTGWSVSNGDVISSNLAITANFTRNTKTYTVIWENYNGDVLEKDENVEYGTTPTYNGSTPTKTGDAQYSYNFVGWDPAVSPVVGNQTYKAQFNSSTNRYTITWLGYDDSVLDTYNNVAYGVTPQYIGPTPTKPETSTHTFEFAGWTPTISAVDGNATYKAIFNEHVKKSTITLVFDSNMVEKVVVNGQTVSVSGGTVELDYGVSFTFVPTFKSGYQFDSWSVGGNEQLLFTPSEPSYTLTLNAKQTPQSTFLVSFAVNDEEFGSVDVSSLYVPAGTTISVNLNTIVINYKSITATPSTANAQYTYAFDSWSVTHGDVISSDTTITANFKRTLQKYTVTWLNHNGTTLKTEQVEYGTTPSYSGPNPTKPRDAQYSYTFAGWSPVVSPVEGEQTYTPQFDPHVNMYTVTWKDYDGSILDTKQVVYGSQIPTYTGNITPSRPDEDYIKYTFIGWDSEDGIVTGNLILSPQFQEDFKTSMLTFNFDENMVEKIVVGGETIDYSGQAVILTWGTSYTIVPTFKQYYGFDSWSTGITTANHPLTLSQDEYTFTLVAKRLKTTITLITSANASVNVNGTNYPKNSSHQITFDMGTSIVCEPIYDNGYYLDFWYLDSAVKLDENLSFIASKTTHEIKHYADIKSYKLTIVYKTDSVQLDSSYEYIKHGTTINPNNYNKTFENYNFVECTETSSFVMSEAKTIEYLYKEKNKVTFTIIHRLNASSAGNDTILKQETFEVYEGEEIDLNDYVLDNEFYLNLSTEIVTPKEGDTFTISYKLNEKYLITIHYLDGPNGNIINTINVYIYHGGTLDDKGYNSSLYYDKECESPLEQEKYMEIVSKAATYYSY